MELAAAKMIGAGLAAIALAGVGVGMGTIFGNYLPSAVINPSLILETSFHIPTNQQGLE